MDIIEEYRNKWKLWEYVNTHNTNNKNEINRK